MYHITSTSDIIYTLYTIHEVKIVSLNEGFNGLFFIVIKLVS